LALGDCGDFGLALQLAEELFEIGSEGEVCLAVGELGVDGVDLIPQAGFPGTQVRHAFPHLVDGDQLFSVCLDHAGDRGAGLRQRGFQPFPFAGDRCRGPRRGEPLIDLGLDQLWIGE